MIAGLKAVEVLLEENTLDHERRTPEVDQVIYRRSRAMGRRASFGWRGSTPQLLKAICRGLGV